MSFEPRGQVAVVTGGARGIGLALGEALHDAGATVVLADLDGERAGDEAQRFGAHAATLDVTDAAAVAALVERVEREHGPVALYCSNAGILTSDAPDWSVIAQDAAAWQRSLDVNVLAHVHACRALLPRMIARGGGAFLITASAAGLLSQTGDAAYSTTKHAAVGFAESLAIAHGDDNIHVCVLCPQGVETAMIETAPNSSATLDGTLPASTVAASALEALREGRFMVLPHPQVADYFRLKADDYDRWIGGMRKLRRRQLKTTGKAL